MTICDHCQSLEKKAEVWVLDVKSRHKQRWWVHLCDECRKKLIKQIEGLVGKAAVPFPK